MSRVKTLEEYLDQCREAFDRRDAKRSELAVRHVPAMIAALEADDEEAFNLRAAELEQEMTDFCRARAEAGLEYRDEFAELFDVESVGDLVGASWSPNNRDGIKVLDLTATKVTVGAWCAPHVVRDPDDNQIIFGVEEPPVVKATYELAELVDLMPGRLAAELAGMSDNQAAQSVGR